MFDNFFFPEMFERHEILVGVGVGVEPEGIERMIVVVNDLVH